MPSDFVVRAAFHLAVVDGENSQAKTSRNRACAMNPSQQVRAKTDVLIVGAGATGSRVARQLIRTSPNTVVGLLDDKAGEAQKVANHLGPNVVAQNHVPEEVDAVVIATRAGSHAVVAQEYLPSASTIVSVGDSIEDVRELLDLDEQARAHGCSVVVGAGMMPGLSDILASHGRQWFDEVREIHVSKFGTGGPDCARQHHRALKGRCFDWRDQQWMRRPGGSGRELAWFPAPVEAADCYRAALSDPLLLIRVHPGVERITSRMAATRRDRLTMQLPMLRRPHPEGLLGAVRVELRGVKDGANLDLVLGCSERPAVTAGAVAATAVEALRHDSVEAGAKGLAEWVDATRFLHALRNRGVRSEVFVGADETY